MKNKIRWIVETGLFLALLIVLQTITKPLGTIVTGSTVNFILIASTVLVGFSSGITIAVISPFLAFFLGVVPLPIHIVPVVAVGNLVIVLSYGLILRKISGFETIKKFAFWIVAIIVGAGLKFGALYAGVNWLVVPLMTTVKGTPVKAPIAIFSTQQILTATIGGVLALLIVPVVSKAIKR